MSLLPARARADLKEAWAGGAGSGAKRSVAQLSAAGESLKAPTDRRGGSDRRSRSERSQEACSRQRESGAGRRPPLVPAPAPRPSGQHEAPDSSSAPTALGTMCRGSGR